MSDLCECGLTVRSGPCGCTMEAFDRLQRDREDAMMAGRRHPVDVPAEAKERPGFEKPTTGYFWR